MTQPLHDQPPAPHREGSPRYEYYEGDDEPRRLNLPVVRGELGCEVVDGKREEKEDEQGECDLGHTPHSPVSYPTPEPIYVVRFQRLSPVARGHIYVSISW